MKCQKCNKNEANTHITKIINGAKTELYLCEKCAEDSGELMSFKTDFDKEFENFFSGFFGYPYIGEPGRTQGLPKAQQCQKCGSTVRDIKEKGRLGCSECYKAFSEFLVRPLKQIHGSTKHTGKIPKRAGKGLKQASELDRLGAELNRAVMEQNFEYAAELRDKINDIKGQMQ